MNDNGQNNGFVDITKPDSVVPSVFLSGGLFCDESIKSNIEEDISITKSLGCPSWKKLKLNKIISGNLWNLFMDLMEESETLLDMVKIESAPSLNNLMRLQWVVYEIKQELLFMKPSLKEKLMEQLIEEESKKNLNINGEESDVVLKPIQH